jgi:hypothetical protein
MGEEVGAILEGTQTTPCNVFMLISHTERTIKRKNHDKIVHVTIG